MTDPHTIARGLTDAQRKALLNAVILLDHCAGEGLGMMPSEQMGETLFAEDVLVQIIEAFAIDVPDHDVVTAFRRVLEEEAGNP